MKQMRNMIKENDAGKYDAGKKLIRGNRISSYFISNARRLRGLEVRDKLTPGELLGELLKS